MCTCDFIIKNKSTLFFLFTENIDVNNCSADKWLVRETGELRHESGKR